MEKPQNIEVNGQWNFDPSSLPESVDLITTGDRQFHLLHQNRSYHAKVLHIDQATRQLHIEVNGRRYEVKMENALDQLVKKMGLSVKSGQASKNIAAPMPGLVLEVVAEVGQTLEKGDKVIILEAMKMENIIKAAGEGRIKHIAVEKGQAVDKGQLLIELE